MYRFLFDRFSEPQQGVCSRLRRVERNPPSLEKLYDYNTKTYDFF